MLLSVTVLLLFAMAITELLQYVPWVQMAILNLPHPYTESTIVLSDWACQLKQVSGPGEFKSL